MMLPCSPHARPLASPFRRRIAGGLSALLAGASLPVRAQDFPSRPITLVDPLPWAAPPTSRRGGSPMSWRGC